jgi:hypothetical protein
LCVVEFVQGDVGGSRVFVPGFDVVEFVCGDGRGFPLWDFVEDEFAEVFFEVGDAVEEADACWGGVEIGAGEDAGDVVMAAEKVDGFLDECRKNVPERGVAADHVVDGQRGKVVVESVTIFVGSDVVFVDESDWVVVSVDWGGVVAVRIEPRGGVVWWCVMFEVFDRVGCEFRCGAVVEVAGHIARWGGKGSQNEGAIVKGRSTNPPQS